MSYPLEKLCSTCINIDCVCRHCRSRSEFRHACPSTKLPIGKMHEACNFGSGPPLCRGYEAAHVKIDTPYIDIERVVDYDF